MKIHRYSYGCDPRKRVKLVAYQLKDVAQVLFEQWRDERPLREGLVDWEVFKATFLERFFLIELRERKLVEFMNLRHGE